MSICRTNVLKLSKMSRHFFNNLLEKTNIMYYFCSMPKNDLYIKDKNTRIGSMTRLQLLCVHSWQIDIESCRPAYFLPDYIEVKQKVGGNPLRLSMGRTPSIYCTKTPALFKANNGDLTSNLLMLESHANLGEACTYGMYVRGNIEFKRNSFVAITLPSLFKTLFSFN